MGGEYRVGERARALSVIKPEDYLLLYSAGIWQPLREYRTSALFDLEPLKLRNLDFHYLVEQAVRNKFVPQLYDFLADNLDEEILNENRSLNRLRQLFLHSLVESKRLFNEFVRILHAMNNRGVDVMPIKGTAFLCFPFFSVDRRQTGDIDLLTPTRIMYEKARADLLNMHYLPHESDLQIGMGYGWAPHLDRGINGKSFRVDLHDATVSRQNWAGRPSMIIPEIWRRRVERNISGMKVFVPSPEDCVRISCAHVFGEVLGELSLRTLTDIIGILRFNRDTFDWGYLIEEFTRSKSETNLYFPLYILYRTLLEAGVTDLVPDLEKVLDELDLHLDTHDEQKVKYWRAAAHRTSLSFPIRDVFEHMYEHPPVWLSFWGCLEP